jgi:homoserine dehydrogenase
MKTLKIGLLGLGQVGGGVYSILRSKHHTIKERCGISIKITGIAVRHKEKKRGIRVNRLLLTKNAKEIINSKENDIIVELIGGIQPAKKWILKSLMQGKHVVTANKALLAEHGRELFREAERQKKHLFFEASVGGGIPIIKVLREGLVSNRIYSIQAIINGTSNYILTKMGGDHLDFKEALQLARDKGYAEADPTLDIDGSDAAHKITILASLVFGGWVSFKDVYVSGITQIRSEDIEFAEEFGFTIKLLAIARKTREGIEVHVRPTLLPKLHVLSGVHGSYNAILMKGDDVGDVLLYGKGAGRFPTGSAVVSDLVDLSKLEHHGGRQLFQIRPKKLKIKNVSSLLSRYYLRFHVVDAPGVLGKISRVLGNHKISISDVIQKERKLGDVVPLILLTHQTLERSLVNSVQVIDRLAITRGKAQVLRIEEM